MLDLLPPPAPWLAALAQPIADKLSFAALPAHVHELVFAYLLYQTVQSLISPVLSTYLFPNIYPKFSRRTRINWDIHVVSLFQSCLINCIAFWVIVNDMERKEMSALERVYGYTGACGLIGALGCGYFIWDMLISTRHIKICGIGSLMHALSSLCVFSLGFRPYLQYYGSTFILYELSSPFLNIHWFCDKLNLTGSRLQWYNGIILLATFAGCRLLWGTYMSVHVYQDIWTALQVPSSMSIADAVSSHPVPPSLQASRQVLIPKDGTCTLGDPTCLAARAETFKYITQSTPHIPLWLAVSTITSNVILNTLNFYWYSKMIKTVKSRFEGKDDPNADKEEEETTLDNNAVKKEGKPEAMIQDAANEIEKRAPEGEARFIETDGDLNAGGKNNSNSDDNNINNTKNKQKKTKTKTQMNSNSVTTALPSRDGEITETTSRKKRMEKE